MTDEKKDPIDKALGAIHEDKKKLLTDQLKSIDEEIVERQLIGAENALGVNDELLELGSEIANRSPPHENSPDLERKDRMTLQRDKRALTRELREEQRDTWKDVQPLREEEREVEQELAGVEQRKRRSDDLQKA